MKIIEGLKKIKDLQRKASDLRDLVKVNCAKSSIESNKYDNQTEKISGWIQAHSDILKEILSLRVAIQRTNILTEVEIVIGDKTIKKTIAEWIHRRRDIANIELSMWKVLSDRGIQEGMVKGPSGDVMKMEIVRFYSPETRDKKIDLLTSEPIIIDSRLEIVNAITDIVE